MSYAIQNRRRGACRERRVNASFRWKRRRHVLPMTIISIVGASLITALLGLAWWYAP